MMLGRDSLHSRSYTRKHKQRSKVFKWVLLFVFILILALSWWVTDKSPLVIKQIDVVGVSALSEENVRDIAGAEMQRRFLIWSKKNALLVPRTDIETALKEQISLIKKVDVEVEGISRLLVTIEEYESTYMVCDVNQGDRCYLSDGAGYIFAPALKNAKATYTRFNKVLDADVVGTRVASKSNFELLVQFKESLADSDLIVTEITIEDEHNVSLTLTQGTRIIIDLQENTDEMLSHLLLLLAEETQKSSSRDAFLEQTEYIDVRHGNKVFYKARE